MKKKQEAQFFELVTRCALILTPKQAFIDWLNKLPDALEVSLEDLREDPTIFLTPDFDVKTDLERFLDKHIEDIFFATFSEWTPDKKKWPGKRDLATLEKYFKITYSSGVFDYEEEQLEDGYFEDDNESGEE